MYSMVSTGQPHLLASQFKFNRDVRERSTRQSNEIHSARPRTNHKERTFAYRASALINNYDIKNSNSLTRALLGLWIFHRLLGGGGGRLNAPPWTRLLFALEKNERLRSKAREKSFRNHFGHFLTQVKIEVTRGKNSKIFQNGFSTIQCLILKVDQRIWYHRVCLVKARRTIYKMTLKGQGQSLTSGQVRPRSRDDRNGSYCISLDSPGQDERTDTKLTSLSLFDQTLLTNDGWWPRVTSNDLSRGRQCKFLLGLSTTVLYDMIPLK